MKAIKTKRHRQNKYFEQIKENGDKSLLPNAFKRENEATRVEFLETLQLQIEIVLEKAFSFSFRITIIITRWDISSAGRAPRSQRGGRRFDPVMFHQ